MRKQPPQPPDITLTQQKDVITQVREYQLITPLYGGGVTRNEADPVTVIRATEIRGHLRFWWRACRGGKHEGKLVPMKKEEDAIWGAAYKKGDSIVQQAQTIQIIVELLKQGTTVKPFRIEKDKKQKNQAKPVPDIPAYAAFPLQPDQNELKRTEPPIPNLRDHISFTLTISFPEEKRIEVETALWAWETFGGLGARTRRGFGALYLEKVDGKDAEHPSSREVEQWLHNKLIQSGIVEHSLFPAHMPHLSSNTSFAIVSLGSPMSVWNTLINKLRDFRQAKNENSSVWPEAKAIRTILHQKDDKVSSAQSFPRAAFGLPIIFHFTGDNAPKDTELKEQGEGKDRFASPLILRPLLCSDNKAVGVALLLEDSRIDAQNLSLREQEGNKRAYPVKSTLSNEEVKSISILKGETDVLQAFMNFLKGEK